MYIIILTNRLEFTSSLESAAPLVSHVGVKIVACNKLEQDKKGKIY